MADDVAVVQRWQGTCADLFKDHLTCSDPLVDLVAAVGRRDLALSVLARGPSSLPLADVYQLSNANTHLSPSYKMARQDGRPSVASAEAVAFCRQLL